jgi:site-specific recombinase XerD
MWRPLVRALPDGTWRWHAVRERGGMPDASDQSVRLMERVRRATRLRHLSRRTEEAYATWIRRYIVFHSKRHPSELGAADVSAFLSWLATEQNVSASTQNQALSALLFLYKGLPRKRGERALRD